MNTSDIVKMIMESNAFAGRDDLIVRPIRHNVIGIARLGKKMEERFIVADSGVESVQKRVVEERFIIGVDPSEWTG